MIKLEIKEKREFIEKILDLMTTGVLKYNEFVTLKTNGSVSLVISASTDNSSVVVTFGDKKPVAELTIPYLPDPNGQVSRIILNPKYVKLELDGLPDVQVPVVS